MNRQGPEWERRETARIFNKYKTGVPDPEDEEECKTYFLHLRIKLVFSNFNRWKSP